MTLTVREKDHWRERIQRRIDRKIKEIEASEPAPVWEEMERRAEQLALDDLAITTLMQESQSLAKQIKDFERDQRQVWAQMAAIIRGVDFTKIEWPCCMPYDVERQIEKRKALFLERLRADHPKGQHIQKLEQEKDELLDTVWLATSASQIKELWSQIAKGLECELTPFQKKALAIDPMPVTPPNESF